MNIPWLGWGQQKYWIFFKDKGYSQSEKIYLIKKEKVTFPVRTLKRRAKMLPKDQLVDGDDLPLFTPYLDEISRMGIQTVVQSRWLNAISAKLTDEQLRQVEQLPFVSKIKPVAGYWRELPPQPQLDFHAKSQSYKFDYGPSLIQNEMLRVPELHDLGFDGSGILVGMLDTGYDYKYHIAFSNLNVKAEYDFINNDSTTHNEDGDASNQHDHGTYTLSALGGFHEGELIGPAFGATFLLAKTEDVRSETPVEEDYWVAGIEWLEREGADVVNSSLGYLDWYSYKDMDGKTATTTIAAEKAIKKGVVVVNSMGNEGTPGNPWLYMIAPADGFNVISVGAVYSNGELVPFSSRGPTYDGRTKPDVVAMGSNVHVAKPSTVSSYRQVGGTSLSSPLIAGVVTLILQAHPDLTPFQVREAIRETADRALNPDNDYGWGLVNAYEAISYHGLFFSPKPEIFVNHELGYMVSIKIFSKNKLIPDSLFVYYTAANENFIRLPLSVSDESFGYQAWAWIPGPAEDSEIQFYFSAAENNGNSKFHPYNAPESYFIFSVSDSTIPPIDLLKNFELYQNYPNPFIRLTTIKYDIIIPDKVTLIIYNIMGQQVRKLVDDEYHEQNPFPYQKVWDGRDDNGKKVTSGIYFYHLKSDKLSDVKRMVFLGSEIK